MKRILSFVLALTLVFSVLLPSVSAEHAHCSHDGCSIHVDLSGNTVTVSGKLSYDGLNTIWLRCGDTKYIDLPYSKTIQVEKGEYFSVNLDISQLTKESDLRVLYRTEGMTNYYYHHYNTVYKLTPAAKGWTLTTSKLIDDGHADEFKPFLDMFTSNAAATNKPADLPEEVTSITTSTDEHNSVTVSINGSTATISGELQYENLTAIWCRLPGSTYSGRPDSKIVDVTSGERFTVTLDLSNVTEETYIKIGCAANGENMYWDIFSDHFRIKPENGRWVLRTAPATDHNLTLQNEWINLADTFDAPISDAVKKQSDEICKGITDDYEKLWALHKWVAENIYYDWDCYTGSTPGVHDPDGVLKKRAAVCQGYAELLEAMIEAQGIPAIITKTYAAGVSNDLDFWQMKDLPSDTNHAHVEAFVNKRWVTMDATWDSNNDYSNGNYETHSPTSYEYFDPTPEDFAYDHIILTREYEEDISDIPASWAAGEILDAMDKHLVPDSLQKDYALNITRAEFSKLIVQLLREKNIKIPTNSTVTFSDTNDPDVLAAAAAGIVLGSNGRFNPDSYITRQEAATMLSRAADVLGIDAGETVSFNDMSSAAGWAVDYINKVSSIVSADGKRVMGGSNNCFDPLGSYTRQQAILTVVRLANCE
ncbi:MAG: S-layer homology domain-containing protein [Clostridia bacterium]|nr:S-layer homology domain-containing protein [Clostridia bacterium]